jgi:hypothetical protein
MKIVVDNSPEYGNFSPLPAGTLNQTKPQEKMKTTPQTIKDLIASTKGRFFSITFIKNNGDKRTINGKNRYDRLVKGTGSPATTALKQAGYVSFVNRNAEGWACAHPDRIMEFKCGGVTHTFGQDIDADIGQKVTDGLARKLQAQFGPA